MTVLSAASSTAGGSQTPGPEASRSAFTQVRADATTARKLAEAVDQIDLLQRTLPSNKKSSVGNGFYPVPPPQDAWPRVFPQL
jgi:hypothetical protein